MDHETDKGNRTRRSRLEIDDLLESFARSGLTQQGFCRENGVSVATFSNWRRKAAARNSVAGPVLRPVCVAKAYGDGPTVRLPGGVEIFLPVGSTAEEIAELIGALNVIGSC